MRVKAKKKPKPRPSGPRDTEAEYRARGLVKIPTRIRVETLEKIREFAVVDGSIRRAIEALVAMRETSV
jgi:hypothetical protein